ncbi:TldD/PmbA family protein [Thermogladius sp. 4427co]|uniref:TldD/PmbA family protein n=1 Tax=Thermogladius sp. 4427co TaxID=3450718 RepID=UPI003F7915C8
MEIDLETWVKKGEELGAEYVDARYQERVYELILLDNGVVRDLLLSKTRGVGFRVVYNGRMGYSSTNNLSNESLREALEKAFKLARASEAGAKSIRLPERRAFRDKIISNYAIEPLEVDLSEKVGLLKSIYDGLREEKYLSSIILRYGFELDRRVVVSTAGDYIDFTRRMIGVGGVLVAIVEGSMERLSHSESRVAGWEFIKYFDWAKYFKENAELVVAAAKARSVEPGRYDVVLDNEMVGLLVHEAFGHASEADIVMSGGSVLENMVGKSVASEHVSIVDDGRVEGGVYIPYDDEANPKKKTKLVEKGVFQGFLHSIETAGYYSTEPTGNGRVMEYSNNILVRQTNIFLEPGDWDPYEIIQDTKRGLYVKGRGAMGGEVDPATGSFTFTGGPSFVIEGGELREVVRGVMLAGNILETLKRIDAVGFDLEVKTSVFGGCGKYDQIVRVGDGGPHVRIRGVPVGG